MCKFTLKALAIASFVFTSGGCTSNCLRHTDCSAGAQCTDGTCIIIVRVEAGTVASLTPSASESSPRDASSSSSAASSSSADAGGGSDASSDN